MFVCLFVYLSARFLSNGGCCRYQMCICGYVQRALGTARVWNVVVKEQRVHGGRLKFTLMCTFLVKAESGGYQTWIILLGRCEERLAQQESGAV